MKVKTIVMPPEDMKTLELNQHQKFDKGLFIIYADLECLIEKIEEIKATLRMHPQQKYTDIFHQIF